MIRGSLGIVDHSFRSQHTADKLIKQKFGVLGAAVGLGVELHRKAVPAEVVNTLAGAVVGIEVAHLAYFRGQGLSLDRIAVVLAGDEGAALADMADGLVGAAVAVLELAGLGTGGQRGSFLIPILLMI